MSLLINDRSILVADMICVVMDTVRTYLRDNMLLLLTMITRFNEMP